MKFIRTTKEIWENLKNEFFFTVDACDSEKNHLIKKYWTIQENALTKNWDKEIVYCHPMYDHAIPKFIKKSLQHDCLTVFLLPSSTNSVYFHKYLWDNKNHKPLPNIEIRFLKKQKGSRAPNTSVPSHNCKKASKYTICAKLCQEKSVSWHSYYSTIPTLLAYFWPCATCATSFFLSLKKKFALGFHYTLAHSLFMY